MLSQESQNLALLAREWTSESSQDDKHQINFCTHFGDVPCAVVFHICQAAPFPHLELLDVSPHIIACMLCDNTTEPMTVSPFWIPAGLVATQTVTPWGATGITSASKC